MTTAREEAEAAFLSDNIAERLANDAMSRLGIAEAKLAEARRLLFEAQMVMRRWGNLCHLEYESLDARIDAWATAGRITHK